MTKFAIEDFEIQVHCSRVDFFEGLYWQANNRVQEILNRAQAWVQSQENPIAMAQAANEIADPVRQMLYRVQSACSTATGLVAAFVPAGHIVSMMFRIHDGRIEMAVRDADISVDNAGISVDNAGISVDNEQKGEKVVAPTEETVVN